VTTINPFTNAYTDTAIFDGYINSEYKISENDRILNIDIECKEPSVEFLSEIVEIVEGKNDDIFNYLLDNDYRGISFKITGSNKEYVYNMMISDNEIKTEISLLENVPDYY
jgi:hypothetical protein